MSKTRMEAFSDGVIAILITIMVLELKLPHGADWATLRALGAPFSAYVMSFVYLGIYWNNHHHMLHATRRINGKILWANLHLLFWLSLVPAGTAWMGDNGLTPLPTAVYGVILFMAAVAYTILSLAIIAEEGPDAPLAIAFGRDVKGKVSILFYAIAIALSFLEPRASTALYVLVALIWLVPDTRIERPHTS
jgi:uncharacterized membrane protein